MLVFRIHIDWIVNLCEQAIEGKVPSYLHVPEIVIRFLITVAFDFGLVDNEWSMAYSIKAKQFDEVVWIRINQTVQLFDEIIDLTDVKLPELGLFNMSCVESTGFVDAELKHLIGTWEEDYEHDQLEEICKRKVLIELFLVAAFLIECFDLRSPPFLTLFRLICFFLWWLQ